MTPGAQTIRNIAVYGSANALKMLPVRCNKIPQ